MLRKSLAAAAVGTMALTAVPAAAQANTDGWSVTLAPYLWMAGLGGDLTLPRREFSPSASFGDVLSNLDFAFMGTAEVRYGRFGVLADFLTLSLDRGVDTRTNLFAGANAEVTTTGFTVLGMYRVLQTPGFAFDIGAGVRTWWIDTDLRLNSGLVPGRSASASTTLTDPIFGIRGEVALSECWSLRVYGDMGGGPSSRLTWQATGAVGYRWSERASIYVGYRHLSIEVDRGPIELNTTISGPIIGASFRF